MARKHRDGDVVPAPRVPCKLDLAGTRHRLDQLAATDLSTTTWIVPGSCCWIAQTQGGVRLPVTRPVWQAGPIGVREAEDAADSRRLSQITTERHSPRGTGSLAITNVS